MDKQEEINALYNDVVATEKRLEEWQDLACYIKDLILEFDHVNDDPIKVLSNIDNIIDTAFGDMDAAKKVIS